MVRIIYIYTLNDPRDRSIRYVGQTCYPKVRLWQHISEGKRAQEINSDPRSGFKIKNKKALWIKELLDVGIAPSIHFICTTESLSEAVALEDNLIKKLLSIGVPLVNHDGIMTKSAKKSVLTTSRFA